MQPLMRKAVAATVVAASAAIVGPAAGQQEGAQIGDVQIRLTTDDGESVTATLGAGRAAREFAALLPMKLTLKDYNATEKIADLPKRLSTQGEPEGFEPRAGDIAYYAPWGNVAIFYKGFRHSSGLVKLGVLNRLPKTFESSAPSAVTIDVVQAQEPR